MNNIRIFTREGGKVNHYSVLISYSVMPGLFFELTAKYQKYNSGRSRSGRSINSTNSISSRISRSSST